MSGLSAPAAAAAAKGDERPGDFAVVDAAAVAADDARALAEDAPAAADGRDDAEEEEEEGEAAGARGATGIPPGAGGACAAFAAAGAAGLVEGALIRARAQRVCRAARD